MTEITICVRGPRPACEVPAPSEVTLDDICPPPRKCWLKAEPFMGGSASWKGSLEKQELAARDAERAGRSSERPCSWARCLDTCPQYSCSGDFPLEKLRLPCKTFTSCPKKIKKDWCYESEGQLIPYCDECPRIPYFCPEPRPKKQPCPQVTHKDIPLYMWSDGHPWPNYGEVPFPFLSRALRPPRIPLPTRIDVPPPCHDPCAKPCLDRCSVTLGGPGLRTRRWRLEELAYNPMRFFDKRAGGFRESPWCTPLPNGGVCMGPPPCKPCACPLL